VTVKTVTVVFTDTGESWALAIGVLNPLDTLSGVFQRLQNLGCVGQDLSFDASNLDLLRTGLLALQPVQNEGEGATPSSPQASTPAPSSTPESTTPFDAEPASDPLGWPDPLPISGDQALDSVPASGQITKNNNGIADDGTIDTDIAALLLKV
jgi:hypothetical protein